MNNLPHILGKASTREYATLHPDLQRLIDWALENVLIDITLVEGHRPVEKQFEYYQKGRQYIGNKWLIVNPKAVITNVDGIKIKGKHNYIPSHAVDFCAYVPNSPYLAWDRQHLTYIAGAIISKANEMYNEGLIKHKVRWGNDWDKDGDLSDNTLVDAPHLEIYIP